MKKILLAFVFVFTGVLCAYSQPGCSLKKDRDGIKVYTCHTDTSRFKSIIAEFTINSSLKELMEWVKDVAGYTKWQFNTTESKRIREISPSEQIYRTVVEAPWPVTDRDMVVQMRIELDEAKHEAFVDAKSVEGILPSFENYVRVPSSRARWVITQKDERHLAIRYTMQIDPGGSVPAWLVNWACAQAPYESFKNLKKILEQE